eukprot:SAG22_NODE_247_length_13918_cov_7.885375_3_plen_224_part_00
MLDWDDTLLPTTQLTDNYGDFITGGAALPKQVVDQLAALQATTINFLAECTALGHVTVITNAMNGWVNLSGRLFVPDVLQTLHDHGIEVIYAREKHGDLGDAEEWKMSAFAGLVESMSDEIPVQRMHLVSIGDSVFERNAAHYASSEYAIGSVKTVKLIDPWEGPTIPQLTNQLQFLTGAMREAVLQDASLDLEMAFPDAVGPGVADQPILTIADLSQSATNQ